MNGPRDLASKIDVDNLASKAARRRKKRDLNEAVHFEIGEKKVSVFTPEFLEHNKNIESDLRKLRKLNNDYEEHNSVLIKYIESLTSSCDHLYNEVKELQEFIQEFKPLLQNLKSEVKDKHDISLD